MLSCRKSVDLLASDEWRTAPWPRRLALWVHLGVCRHCRSYKRALQRMGETARRLYRSEPEDAQRADRVLDAVRRAAERTNAD